MNVMRGDPVVMPLAVCQCLDQVVRFALQAEHRLPDLDLVQRPIAQNLRELAEVSLLYSLSCSSPPGG